MGRPSIRDEATEDAIIERLADGESLSSICRDDAMPSWRTVHNWIDADEDFSARITRAREVGFETRADRALLEAKTAEDASKGRLAFDAERWYLGKLSNAFSDNKVRKVETATEVTHRHDLDGLADEELGALERILTNAARGKGCAGEAEPSSVH